MRLPRLRSCLLLAVFLSSPVLVATAAPADKAQVLVMGTFHFANPGLDMIKSPVADVLSPASQAWLASLAARVAAFAPTDVLVECAATCSWPEMLANRSWPLDENEAISGPVATAWAATRLTRSGCAWPGPCRAHASSVSTSATCNGKATG